MRLNRKGETEVIQTASHVGLWIGIIVIGGWLVWSATHNKTKNQTFDNGSKQTNTYHITKNYGLAFADLALMPFNIHGCTRPDKLEQEPEQATNEVSDAKFLVNAVVNQTDD